MVDASQIIAHDARVISAVLRHEILQPQGPLGSYDGAEVPARFLVVLQPGDVRPGIADARTPQSQHVAGGLHHRDEHLVALVEHGRALQRRVVVLVRRVILGLLVFQFRVDLVALQAQRPRLGQVCESARRIIKRSRAVAVEHDFIGDATF